MEGPYAGGPDLPLRSPLAIAELLASSETDTQTAQGTREQQSYRQQAPRQSGALAYRFISRLSSVVLPLLRFGVS